MKYRAGGLTRHQRDDAALRHNRSDVIVNVIYVVGVGDDTSGAGTRAAADSGGGGKVTNTAEAGADAAGGGADSRLEP